MVFEYIVEYFLEYFFIEYVVVVVSVDDFYFVNLFLVYYLCVICVDGGKEWVDLVLLVLEYVC